MVFRGISNEEFNILKEYCLCNIKDFEFKDLTYASADKRFYYISSKCKNISKNILISDVIEDNRNKRLNILLEE